MKPQLLREQVEAARDGDPRARGWIAEQYGDAIYRFSVRMLREEQDALDATQDTLIKVLRSLHRFDDRRRFSTWVFSIARNTCIDRIRKRGRTTALPGAEIAHPGPSPFELTAREREARRLENALAALSPAYREVLVLYHFEHLKYREIAEALQVPLGTVMNRIFRARRQMRDLLETERERESS